MEKLRKQYILLLKYATLAATVVISFFSLGLSLVIVLLLNIRVIRNSLFGRLPFNIEETPWGKIRTEEYLPGIFLDIYYPKTDRPEGTVLFAHGGGWISGYRRQPNNVSWYRFMVSRGFIVATIEYSRGYKAGIDRLIDEFTGAVQYLSKQAAVLGLKQEKISIMGLSAGGHLALLGGMKNPSQVKNITAYYSPCDLLDIWNSTSLFARFSVTTVIKRLPYKKKSKDVYRRYSPVRHVSAQAPPILLVHGLKDSIVPCQSSITMYETLIREGCPAKLLIHPTGNHGFEFVLKDERTRDIIEETLKFWSNADG